MKMRFESLPKPMLDGIDVGGGEAGAEAPETAEPDETNTSIGEEETELAEQSNGKTDADHAFAEMRRENEELKATNQELENALGQFFEGDTDQKVISANALAQGKTEQEIRDEIEAEQEWDRLNQENEQLNNELIDIKTKAQMEQDLRTIQAIDPSVESLESLGSDFLDYISSGLDAKQAYYAVQAKNAAERPEPPAEVGKVNQSTEPKDYYSREEVEGMSQKEVHDNYEAIRKSMSRWT